MLILCSNQEYRFLTKLQTKLTEFQERITIGNQYDYTDKVFRQTLPIFDSKPTLQIDFSSNAKDEPRKVSVFWLSPSKKVVAAQRNIVLNVTRGATTFGPDSHLR